eukprot:TRINITY_DN18420_c0_g1_i1.p1 TRINITY_DN18420_c0_g1~~TRINITY_DN18420_c0_g1_i1.p1  ORF type:complete len:121 (+),score=29.11 TRINITY_DN18420_c0_g1_i1:59-421(+)
MAEATASVGVDISSQDAGRIYQQRAQARRTRRTMHQGGNNLVSAIASEASSAELKEIEKWRQSMIPSQEDMRALHESIAPNVGETDAELTKRMKTHAISELIKTEKDYVTDLNLLNGVFL